MSAKSQIKNRIDILKATSIKSGQESIELLENRLEGDLSYVARRKAQYLKECEAGNFDKAADVLDELQHHFTSNVLGNLRLDLVSRNAAELKVLSTLSSLDPE